MDCFGLNDMCAKDMCAKSVRHWSAPRGKCNPGPRLRRQQRLLIRQSPTCWSDGSIWTGCDETGNCSFCSTLTGWGNGMLYPFTVPGSPVFWLSYVSKAEPDGLS